MFWVFLILIFCFVFVAPFHVLYFLNIHPDMFAVCFEFTLESKVMIMVISVWLHTAWACHSWPWQVSWAEEVNKKTICSVCIFRGCGCRWLTQQLWQHKDEMSPLTFSLRLKHIHTLCILHKLLSNYILLTGQFGLKLPLLPLKAHNAAFRFAAYVLVHLALLLVVRSILSASTRFPLHLAAMCLFSCRGVFTSLLRTTCVTAIPNLRLEKHASYFKRIHRWPSAGTKICSFHSVSHLSVMVRCSPEGALIWAICSSSLELRHCFDRSLIPQCSQHTCPPPGFPLLCSPCVRFISCTWYSVWAKCMEMLSLDFGYDTWEQEKAVGGDGKVLR